MFYHCLKFWCMLAFRFWFKLEYSGMEHIPLDKGYIIISNHQSNIDPILMSGKIKKQIRFMGKAELFNIPVFGIFFTWLGGFPVDRGKGDTTAIDTATEILNNNQILGMFPEGTRSKDGNPLRPKSGVALIAQITGADILPCGFIYHNERKFRSKVSIAYGKIITNAELGFTEEKSPREMKYATRLLFGRVLNLIGMEDKYDNKNV